MQATCGDWLLTTTALTQDGRHERGIELLLVVTVIGLLMARRASRYLWTAVLGAGLIYWTVFHHPTATAIVKYH